MIIQYEKTLNKNRVYMSQILSPAVAELQEIVKQLNEEIEKLKRQKADKVNIHS